MDRHFRCPCGGTAWVTRDEGYVTIECSSCGTCATADTFALAKDEWLRRTRSDSQKQKRRDP